MRVKILGSAAGGGFPQWNCACRQCAGFRGGRMQAKSRTQSQVAVSAGGAGWYLLNASPDLRFQIEAEPSLRPARSSKDGRERHSPIHGVVLTNADLDHVLGLLLMREDQPLSIYASSSVRRILTEDNSVFGMLRQSRGQTIWHDFRAGARFEPNSADGTASGLRMEPIALPGSYPRYVDGRRSRELSPMQALFGLSVESAHGSRRLAFLPGLGQIEEELLERLESLDPEDLLLVDGTFWSDDELARIRIGARTARQMNHLPISGHGGTLERLEGVRARRVFTHINNTNPILDEESPERARVLDAGWEVGFDGMEFEL